MRDSIGSALLLNIVIVIVGVISTFLISSIAYSKAYKVKNKILSIIEEYDGECNFQGYGTDDCTKKIEDVLYDIGYSTNIKKSGCDDIEYTKNKSTGILEIKNVYNGSLSGGHQYCVYKYVLCDLVQTGSDTFICANDSNKQFYYKVITYMHFDIPVVENFLEFPISGETKSFYDTFASIKY